MFSSKLFTIHQVLLEANATSQADSPSDIISDMFKQFSHMNPLAIIGLVVVTLFFITLIVSRSINFSGGYSGGYYEAPEISEEEAKTKEELKLFLNDKYSTLNPIPTHEELNEYLSLESRPTLNTKDPQIISKIKDFLPDPETIRQNRKAKILQEQALKQQRAVAQAQTVPVAHTSSSSSPNQDDTMVDTLKTVAKVGVGVAGGVLLAEGVEEIVENIFDDE